MQPLTAKSTELSKYDKPWNGIPRDSINWNPTVNEAACIGCGLCVTTCGREVYRFDFDRKRSVVVSPSHCMVGCSTCGNLCPTQAISFPDSSTVQAMLSRPEVLYLIQRVTHVPLTAENIAKLLTESITFDLPALRTQFEQTLSAFQQTGYVARDESSGEWKFLNEKSAPSSRPSRT